MRRVTIALILALAACSDSPTLPDAMQCDATVYSADGLQPDSVFFRCR